MGAIAQSEIPEGQASQGRVFRFLDAVQSRILINTDEHALIEAEMLEQYGEITLSEGPLSGRLTIWDGNGNEVYYQEGQPIGNLATDIVFRRILHW